MPKNTKRMCLDLIAEKKLPYTIKRIGQLDRLVPNKPELGGDIESTPVFSWSRLYEFLLTLPGGATS
jgi:hypothetical protein